MNHSYYEIWKINIKSNNMNSFTIDRKELWGLLRTMAIPDSKVNARCEMRGAGANFIKYSIIIMTIQI